MEFTVDQIAQMLEGEVVGDGQRKIENLKKIQEGAEGCLSFLSNLKYEPYLYTTKASAVIVSSDFEPKENVSTTLIKVKDPYSSFTILLEEYHRFVSFQKVGTEEPSYQGDNLNAGDNLYRGAFSYIGDNVTLGQNVKIHPQSFIGDNVQIGDNCILHPGARVLSGSVLGSHCVIQSGAVIGSDGFGFAPQGDGSYRPIPQLGHVVLKDHVHIGANTTIDRATMQGDVTAIEEGVKLDNLIQVAHNVVIGSHTVIAAQTGIAGSTTIGKFSSIGGQAGIIGHIKLSDKLQIGAQAGIMTDAEEGSKLLGSPAMNLREYLASYAQFRRLPDLNKRLRDLEEKVLNLPTPSK